MITTERQAELMAMKESLTVSDLLTLTSGELIWLDFKIRRHIFKVQLKKLVLSADLEHLIKILERFNDDEPFYFLEDLICDSKVPAMSESQYCEYMGE